MSVGTRVIQYNDITSDRQHTAGGVSCVCGCGCVWMCVAVRVFVTVCVCGRVRVAVPPIHRKPRMLAMSERLQVTVYSPHPARQGPTGSCTTPHAAEYRGHQGREFPHGHRLPMPRKSRRTRNGSGATGGECSTMAASHSPRPSPPAVDEQSRNNVSTTCPSNAPNPHNHSTHLLVAAWQVPTANLGDIESDRN